MFSSLRSIARLTLATFLLSLYLCVSLTLAVSLPTTDPQAEIKQAECQGDETATTGPNGVATCPAAVPSTTTIPATATNSGSCDDFTGACVVYGGESGSQQAPYTTTVYAGSTSATSVVTSDVTATTTVYVSESANASGACEGFSGACVIYATGNSGAAYTTTVYQPAASSGNSGNGDGAIGESGSDGNQGYISAAGRVFGWWTSASFMGMALGLLLFAARM